MIVKKIDIDAELKRVERVFKDKRRRIEKSNNRHLKKHGKGR